MNSVAYDLLTNHRGIDMITYCLMLCSLIAIQVSSEVTFGKKRDDKNYLVPKRILRDALGKPLKFIIVEDGVKANSNSDFSGAPVGNQLKFGEEFRALVLLLLS